MKLIANWPDTLATSAIVVLKLAEPFTKFLVLAKAAAISSLTWDDAFPVKTENLYIPAASSPDNPNCLVNIIWVSKASAEYSATPPVAVFNSFIASAAFLRVTFILVELLATWVRFCATLSALSAP